MSSAKGYASTMLPGDSNSLASLNDEERRIWEAWESRDKASESQHASDSSTSQSLQKNGYVEEQRNSAQKKLIEHAHMALALHGSPKRPTDKSTRLASPTNAVSAPPPPPPPPPPAPAPKTSKEQNEPARNVQVAARDSNMEVVPAPTRNSISVDHLTTLEKFSATLKNEGVQVLKLGRGNKWQIRYLTVSREFTSLKPNEAPEDIGGCPRALLWLKKFNVQDYSLSNLKAGGRGGLLFSKLQSVYRLHHSDHYKRAPRKIKHSFPIFAGVCVEYLCDDSIRKLIMCFKRHEEAQAFCTAMEIIKEVNDRREEDPVQSINTVAVESSSNDTE